MSGDRDLASLALVAWWFVYFSVSWAAAGTTLGMAVLGLRVVQPDGAPVGLARAVTRTLAFSLSVALFGLGFLGIVLHNQRRALHDLVAGTAVIYTMRPQPSGDVVAAQRIIRTG